jgi:hypothetical protein
MEDKKLLEYVKTNLEKGYALSDIRRVLEEAGWTIPEIDHAIALAQGKKPGPPPEPHVKPVPEAHPEPAHPGTPGKKAGAGFAVSMVAAILMIIAGAANLLVGFAGFQYVDLEFLYTLGLITQDSVAIIIKLASPLGQALAVVGFVAGIITVYGAVLMRKGWS